ncbi:hypothetical protein CO054_02520 [Candidatus Shapirobacteria bacterium CG_4_9_14_0_2_um_filter_39_11]|uniref:Uncharacterized protein n=1 Tax=Candidatus Shapirobacteria bacterium CG_4_9_14_0_2_um_filter_39_11 TaxID=1974478 RepID=A0A2M8ESC2_9BACT|nr:MAG: hypothetical protein CO054_02520 [Candidatus Shapirobacteria bacterium CG_4_9_14_0_2_um_filter_39_11]
MLKYKNLASGKNLVSCFARNKRICRPILCQGFVGQAKKPLLPTSAEILRVFCGNYYRMQKAKLFRAEVVKLTWYGRTA